MSPFVLLAAILGVVFIVVKILTRPPAPLQHIVPLHKQTVEVDPADNLYVRRNAQYPAEFLANSPGVRTLYDGFMAGCKKSGDQQMLGWREGNSDYKWLTYNQVRQRMTNLGSGLVDLGLSPGQETFVGIYAQNCVDWVVTEQAVNAYDMVAVPLYDTLGPDAVKFIVNQAKIPVVVCDPPKLGLLLGALSDCKTLKFVIKMGNVTDQERKDFAGQSVQIFSISEVEAKGSAHHVPHVPPAPDHLATVCYTSGTTGDPKGAMLTHGNLIANSVALVWQINSVQGIQPFNSDDVMISYLPLAHMFERIMEACLWQYGASIGFFRGNVQQLMEDIMVLKPTIFPSVPRLLNKLYDRVRAGVEEKGGLAKHLFEYGLSAKSEEVRQGIFRKNSVWDFLVFKKVQARLGGRVRVVATGAAPISAACLTFLRAALGCPVMEGYGQTEATAAITTSLGSDGSTGHVGCVLPCNEVRLDDVKDMKYFAKEGKGEVCARGPNVMKGYLYAPEKTAEAIDKDGWLHTGDIGEWTKSGQLRIIDRKKAIFKLNQGEYVAPEKIENIYVRCGPVAQIFVYGDSLRSSCVGIVVPDPDVFPKWAATQGGSGSLQEMCASPAVTKAMLQALVEEGKAGGLKGFEQVRAIKLVAEPFTVENGLLTPTFKAKRPQLLERFKDEIDQLYSTVEE